MPVATPLSLTNIITEFGEELLTPETYNSGTSQTITAPADASRVRIFVWGGGGGGAGGSGGSGGGGGGGGFATRTVDVVGNSTQFTYTVGSGGALGTTSTNGSAGGASTVTSAALPSTLSGGGGGGGITYSSGGAGGSGGSTSGGSTGSEAGQAGQNQPTSTGGDAGGAAYGGGAGGSADPTMAGQAPGGGGGGGADGSGAGGAAGRITFQWLRRALTDYTRGGGRVPDHSANSNIPSSTTGLSISDFSGAELSFSGTVTVGNDGGGIGYGGYGFRTSLSYGSINRAQVGLTRSALSNSSIVSLYEFGFDTGFNTVYYGILEFNSNVTYSTLGYYFFDSVVVNGITYNRSSADTPNGTWDGSRTTWSWITGVDVRAWPTSGTNAITINFAG